MKHFRSVILSLLLLAGFQVLYAQQPGDTTVVIFGDTRTNHEVHRAIVKDIMTHKPLAVFHTGDLVFNGKKNSDWSLFHQIMKPVTDSCRFYPSYGNHERHSEKMTIGYSVPNNGKWYSVDIGKVHYTVIDNYSDFSEGSEQYQWLEKDLSSCTKGFSVVVMHLPVFSSGPHQTRVKKLQSTLKPLFEKCKVDMVFSGHNHCYEKAFANNIYYITTAGGGAPLYPKTKNIAESKLYIKTYNYCTLTVEENILTTILRVRVFDINNKILDEFSINEQRK